MTTDPLNDPSPWPLPVWSGDAKPSADALTGPELRGQQIKLRRLEIAATLAEWKRLYFAEGIERPMADRATLEAEDAKLALEARVIGSSINEAHIARRKRLNDGLLAQLLEVLKERGADNLIAEAKARSDAALAAAEVTTL